MITVAKGTEQQPPDPLPSRSVYTHDPIPWRLVLWGSALTAATIRNRLIRVRNDCHDRHSGCEGEGQGEN
jgi:hypothetical protein